MDGEICRRRTLNIKTALTWSCADTQLVRRLNDINTLISCTVTNTNNGWTGCISSLQWITGQNPPMMSRTDSTPDPNVKQIHSSSELWVWISGPEAVIIHCFPPNTCWRCLKKARLCFWDENPKLHWRRKKTHPGTGRQVHDPCLFQPTSPSLTPELPFLLSGAASPWGVSALSQSRAGECGGDASARSNPVCGIIQIEAMPFQDCWTGLVSMLQIAGRQVT